MSVGSETDKAPSGFLPAFLGGTEDGRSCLRGEFAPRGGEDLVEIGYAVRNARVLGLPVAVLITVLRLQQPIWPVVIHLRSGGGE